MFTLAKDSHSYTTGFLLQYFYDILPDVSKILPICITPIVQSYSTFVHIFM